MVLGICGLANAADAVEILSVGLLGAAAERDLNLTPTRTGALNACIFVGMFLVSSELSIAIQPKLPDNMSFNTHEHQFLSRF